VNAAQVPRLEVSLPWRQNNRDGGPVKFPTGKARGLGGHLAAYKVPRAIQFATQLPMTSSGKIMRRLLTEIDDGTPTTAPNLTPAAT
jgi:acyl-CoA synthetase (AMP-forming)/AMP-acid ligase II